MASIPFRKSFSFFGSRFLVFTFFFSLLFCCAPIRFRRVLFFVAPEFFLSHQFVLDLSIFLSRSSVPGVPGVYCCSFFFIPFSLIARSISFFLLYVQRYVLLCMITTSKTYKLIRVFCRLVIRFVVIIKKHVLKVFLLWFYERNHNIILMSTGITCKKWQQQQQQQ